jgi:hypothetical protein
MCQSISDCSLRCFSTSSVDSILILSPIAVIAVIFRLDSEIQSVIIILCTGGDLDLFYRNGTSRCFRTNVSKVKIRKIYSSTKSSRFLIFDEETTADGTMATELVVPTATIHSKQGSCGGTRRLLYVIITNQIPRERIL